LLEAEQGWILAGNFADGKRIFGNNKTFRGFFFGWGVGFGVVW